MPKVIRIDPGQQNIWCVSENDRESDNTTNESNSILNLSRPHRIENGSRRRKRTTENTGYRVSNDKSVFEGV